MKIRDNTDVREANRLCDKIHAVETELRAKADELRSEAEKLEKMASYVLTIQSRYWSEIHEDAEKFRKKHKIKKPFWDWVYGMPEEEWEKLDERKL